MSLRVAALVGFLSLCASLPVYAGDASAANRATNDSPSTAAETTPALPDWVVNPQAKRPAALTALYGSYGALAVADLVSTNKALSAGATETNPVMGSGTTTRMVLVKAAGASMSIYFAERMWKKNKVGAILTMAVVNGISAAVVARNARIARR